MRYGLYPSHAKLNFCVSELIDEDSYFLSTVGLLIDDIRFDAIFFNQLRYSNIKREDNKVAHSLTQYALGILDFVVWMEDVLPPLFFVVQTDIVRFH